MSDTHSHLDAEVFNFFAQVDEIWHAGDFGATAVPDALEAFKPLRGVYGNIDSTEIRQRFGEHLEWETEGLNVYMTHIGGFPGKYPTRIREELKARKPDLFICGHSHILKIIPDKTLNLLHINPGACGLEGWHKLKTWIRFEVADGKISQLEILEKVRK
jgi:uncharacterized protein